VKPSRAQNASLEIEFEGGGRFTAELLETDAPKTCESISSRLPLEFEFYHSIFSGQAIFSEPEGLIVEPENQMAAGIPPGTITFFVRDPPRLAPDEIHITYGIFIPRGPPFPDYALVNVFAQVRKDLDDLRIVGQRIWKKGAETAVFRIKR